MLPVIVVLASRYDIAARPLAEGWAKAGACVLTPEDLSAPGWRHHLSDPAAARAVVNGRPVALRDIRGVITRLPWVTEAELPQIVSADRAYVASEMSAFLLFWLAELSCPMLNRPTHGSLNGPCWRPEQWVAHAGRAGLRVRCETRSLRASAPPPLPPQRGESTVTVIGDRCLGRVHGSLLDRSRRLAELANVDLLGIELSSPDPDAFFVNATVYPEIDSVEASDALLEYFQRA